MESGQNKLLPPECLNDTSFCVLRKCLRVGTISLKIRAVKNLSHLLELRRNVQASFLMRTIALNPTVVAEGEPVPLGSRRASETDFSRVHCCEVFALLCEDVPRAPTPCDTSPTKHRIGRYLFYAFGVMGSSPYPLFYLRYSLFAILYPTGIIGEMLTMYAGLPELKVSDRKHCAKFVFPVVAKPERVAMCRCAPCSRCVAAGHSQPSLCREQSPGV